MAIVNSTVGGTGTGTDIYTAAAKAALVVAYICNTDSSAVTVNVHAVPSGGIVEDENKLYHNLTIPAGDTFIIDSERLILDPGDKIFAEASVPNLVFATVSYTEM